MICGVADTNGYPAMRLFKINSDNIMLCYSLLSKSRNLLHRSSASIIIYMKDHNKLINPPDSQLKLSYAHPNSLVPEAPKHKHIDFKLDPELQKLIERQIFEEYKIKLLRGIIDEVPQKPADPLWGYQEPPVHYYRSYSKEDLMSVSHPQNRDFQTSLQAIKKQYFAAKFTDQVNYQNVQNADLHQLVEISLKAREDGVSDGEIWFAIERRLDRGHKLHLLNSDELIKLKYAFDGVRKYGTPIFHQILAALLREDTPKLNKLQLTSLFYACRYSNPGKTNVQLECLKALETLYSTFSFEQKANFLFTYALCSKPLKIHKKVQKRRRYQFRELSSAFLLRLNLWDLELTDDTTAKIVYALAKLRLPNTKFITLPVLQYIQNNVERYTQDKDRLYQAILYLTELQAGQGVIDQAFMTQLREKAVGRWNQFSKIQHIRMIHTWWNWGLFDQALLQLYKSVQFQLDSTFLYYACQIELSNSSEREWQIIHMLSTIQRLPLPYYPAYRRFFNHIKSSTEWKMQGLSDKLVNTEYYYSVMRHYDSLYSVASYRQLRQFQKFVQTPLAQIGNPIQNLQLVHFAFPKHQVSLDIITKKQTIPGTDQLKQTYKNKVRSLKTLGWVHLSVPEERLKATSIGNVIANIQQCYVPYIEDQKAVIEYQHFQRAEKIEEIKTIQEVSRWDLKTLNSFIAGDQEIVLGEEYDENPLGVSQKQAEENLRNIQEEMENE